MLKFVISIGCYKLFICLFSGKMYVVIAVVNSHPYIEFSTLLKY